MIREFTVNDLDDVREIHAANGLPENCFPDLYIQVGGERERNLLFTDRYVMEQEDKLIMACFLKATAEIYLVLDHSFGDPRDRYTWLWQMKEFMADRARRRGYEQVSCWIPPDLDKSFGPRLEELGFQKSWQSYSFNL